MSELKPVKTDVPVAMIFFNRPEQLKKVFATVKEARPSKLFLIQDGPRENNESDIINIKKCREIFDDIDWECDVVKDFSDVNLGCGRRIFTGITKCFEQVDRLIIIEDDCVASESFFPFCKEMLERYIDSDKIGMITGMNHLNTYNSVKSDYFFARVGSIAGWATWKRTWDKVDFDMDFLNDEEAVHILKGLEKNDSIFGDAYSKACQKHEIMKNGGKLTSWSTQFGIAQILNYPLIIVPRVNLMTNIGLTEESANSVKSIKLVPHRQRALYRLKLYKLDFPLKHPKYIVDDWEYDSLVNNFMNPPKMIAFFNRVESIFLRVVHGDFGSLSRGLKKRLNKIKK